ncbi:unnamed protein product [Brassica rapa]|uniref:DUF1985 domain-containing protein n=1 Tax=Brassica campestris TaxID=3711 RepID=A0A8D9HYY7_BRACM|nr:unnamed protein product [Brassica rapa]
MIFFGLGVWQTYVVVLYRRFSSTGISKAIRRKPYRGRVPPLSSPLISPIMTNLICNGLGPHLLRPYLLRQYLLQLLLLKDYLDDSERLLGRLPGSRPSLKMDLPELPLRMFTLGEEPDAIRSISYHSDDTKLFKALCDCLTADEYEDMKKASKLGVFIKFKELEFGWTSRLVHFLLCFQLDIKKKFERCSLVASQPARFSLIEFDHLTGLNCDYIKDLENPRCEVTKEMAAFWEKMRVDLDTGPSIEQITKAFYHCDEWSQDDRMRLGYFAIYAGYIEGKKFSSATSASLARLVVDLEKFENYPWGRVVFKVLMDSLKAKDLTQTGYTVDGFIQVLQVWAYYAMPELGVNYGSPIPNRPSPLLLAYKGGKRQRKCFKAAIKKQNFVPKDFDEMFPKWDGDVDDPAADNIIKVMFNDPEWKWTME